MREAPPLQKEVSHLMPPKDRLISSMNEAYSCTQVRISTWVPCPKKSMDCSIAPAFKFTFFIFYREHAKVYDLQMYNSMNPHKQYF